MCRWIAYSGTPVLLSQSPIQPEHSLIDQSSDSRAGVETTNVDGFGVGQRPQRTNDPAVVLHALPAWNDRPLPEVARYTRSPLSFGHIRPSTGTAVRQRDCHPFPRGRWLWMHNRMIGEFRGTRRHPTPAVALTVHAGAEGSTDSQVRCIPSFTFGLTGDPHGAAAPMAGRVETTAGARGTPHPPRIAVTVTERERICAVRHSGAGQSRSSYVALRALHPDLSRLRELSDETRPVVSKPLKDLPHAWNEVLASGDGAVQARGVLHRSQPASADRPGPRGRGPW